MVLLTLGQVDFSGPPAEPMGPSVLVSPFVAVFILAFLASLIATPIMRVVATKYGVIDEPDFKRKAHLEPVAYLGGIALLIGWLAGLGGLYFTDFGEIEAGSNLAAIMQMPGPFPLVVVAIGAIVITTTGVVDDIYGVSPSVKVGGQLIAAAALAYKGVATGLVSDTFGLIGFDHLDPKIAYMLATVFIAVLVIGACNAMNLIDGLDGLAAGVAGIAFTGFLMITVIFGLKIVNGDQPAAAGVEIIPVLVVVSLASLGAVLGFLPYNFNPANIFMGDAGSLLLGYLGAASILLFAKAPAVYEGAPTRGPLLVMAALIVFGVPICDSALAIFRRKMRGQSIFSPDRQHLHHLLLHFGFGVKKSVAVMYCFGIVCAMLGCSLIYLDLGGRFIAPIFVVVFAFVTVTAYKNGHRYALLEQRKHEAAAKDAEAAATEEGGASDAATAADPPAAPTDVEETTDHVDAAVLSDPAVAKH